MVRDLLELMYGAYPAEVNFLQAQRKEFAREEKKGGGAKSARVGQRGGCNRYQHQQEARRVIES